MRKDFQNLLFFREILKYEIKSYEKLALDAMNSTAKFSISKSAYLILELKKNIEILKM